jgi:hypothetical protein
LLAALFTAGWAWAGVSPTIGGQNMSGARIKAPEKHQAETGESSAENEDAGGEDRR